MYLDFQYYTPTKVVFGKGAEAQVGQLVKEQGCKKVLIHYGGKSAVKSGLIGRIEAALTEAGLAHFIAGFLHPGGVAAHAAVQPVGGVALALLLAGLHRLQHLMLCIIPERHVSSFLSIITRGSYFPFE